MGPLPEGPRRASRGKLTAVLDHQLRIGDGEVSESIIAAYKERGLQPPEHIADPPDIKSEFLIYWQAYRDLQTERRTPRGAIPVNAIFEYADGLGVDRDQLKRIVWEVDKTLLEYWKGLDEAEKRRQETEKTRKRLGGSS